MFRRRKHASTFAMFIAATTIAVAVARCRAAPSDASRDAQPAAETLTGTVTLDGSSTVLPVAEAITAAFAKTHPRVHVSVSSSSTSDGLNRLCAGQLDIAAASRPINSVEIQACQSRRVEFIELPIAFDSVSVVVHPTNSFVECLSVAELKRIWDPTSEGRVQLWRDVRPTFPAQPLELFGPDRTSGTFDYFTLAVTGTEGRSRSDYTKRDDDTALANAVAANPNGLAYFGYAYYQANHDRLKLVAIDGGQGCVAPSSDAVKSADYQPLSRPVFFYVRTVAAARPEVRSFVSFAVSANQPTVVHEVGYVPLPPVILLHATQRLSRNATGSVFGGRGSILGLTATMLAEEEDKTKNALVRD